jgi:hypothetical protein
MILMKRLFFSVIASILFGFIGCNSEDDETRKKDDGNTFNEGEISKTPCPSSTRIGGFVVEHQKLGEKLTVTASGSVADGVQPDVVPAEVLESGSCRLLQVSFPFCESGCAGEFCVADDTCVAFPKKQDLGDVFIEGLIEPVLMKPRGDYGYFDSSMPYPAFEPGAPIVLSAIGKDLPGFTLHAEGVTPIVVTDTSWQIEKGQALTMNWEADVVQNATVVVTINIDMHGTSPGNIVCEGPDTGTMTIDVELIDRLMEMGISGFPTATIERVTAESINTNIGCIDFKVLSFIDVELIVPSHMPCLGPEDCPEGQVCDLDLQICI